MLNLKVNTSGSDFTEGWHEVVIASADAGDWNGTKYIDLRFNDFPESLKCRIWSAKNKETGEDFGLGNLYYYAVAGITTADDDGNLSIDDKPTNLVGKRLNVLFYKKDNGYTEIVDRVAPVITTEGPVIFTDSHVASLKTKAETRRDSKVGTPVNGVATTESSDGVPAF